MAPALTYVYSVSPDTLYTYVNADDFILMRVPKSEITERSRYEFLSGFDDNGSPTWSLIHRPFSSLFDIALPNKSVNANF